MNHKLVDILSQIMILNLRFILVFELTIFYIFFLKLVHVWFNYFILILIKNLKFFQKKQIMISLSKALFI